jgi:glycosyltransferase involved in cell wall biosynthesis
MAGFEESEAEYQRRKMISCILTSSDRPTLVLQALESIERQTHRDYELIVVDDSAHLDIHRAMRHFRFPSVQIHHFDVASGARSTVNRLGVNINFALTKASGDLIAYLCDDDYFFNDWFEKAAAFFHDNPQALQGFGSLIYSKSMHMDFSQSGSVRWFDRPVSDPKGKLDHGQVIHRRRIIPVKWPEAKETTNDSDGLFFRELSRQGVFYPIHASAVVKRLHGKNLQSSAPDGGLRE